MGKTIVLLFEVFPIETYVKRYDYQTLVDNGYKLEICDLSGIISEVHSIKNCDHKNTKDIKYFTFSQKDDFKKYIKQFDKKNTFIWTTFQFTAEYFWIFKTISKLHYGFMSGLDYYYEDKSISRKSLSYWTNWSFSRIVNAVLLRLPRNLIPLRKSDAVITYEAGGVQRKLKNLLCSKHTVIELSNTLDYYNCISQFNNATLDIPDKYIVYIDEYMPYHPDAQKMGLSINAKKYYTEIESFLNNLSKHLQLPVIVAAHPKANYVLHKECFSGMKIIQFRTADLIKGASLVVTHLSIAISMILICRKPFLFITTDEIINKVNKFGITESYEKEFQCKCYNISEEKEIDYDVLINETKKMDDKYFDSNLSKFKLSDGHPNEGLSFGQIVIKAMNRVKNQNA